MILGEGGLGGGNIGNFINPEQIGAIQYFPKPVLFLAESITCDIGIGATSNVFFLFRLRVEAFPKQIISVYSQPGEM